MTSIVIYFSRSGENYFGGVLKNIEKGNTEDCRIHSGIG